MINCCDGNVCWDSSCPSAFGLIGIVNQALVVLKVILKHICQQFRCNPLRALTKMHFPKLCQTALGFAQVSFQSGYQPLGSFNFSLYCGMGCKNVRYALSDAAVNLVRHT